MKNKFKIIVLIVMLFSLTGCTKYLKDENKQIIKNETTGQNLPSNILCQPTDETTIKIYEEYNATTKNEKVELDKLPACKSMPIKSKNYDGLWVTLFVQPLAWLIIKIGNLVNNYGLAIILCTLLIRMIVYPFTKKTAMQSENMKKAQNKLNRIEKKYQNKTDTASMQQKAQELQLVYKEYDINPFQSCLVMFIQIPLFFAFYEAITRIPAIFEEKFLGLNLGTSPNVGILTQHNMLYLVLIILVVLATYFSFKFNSRDLPNNGENQQFNMKTMTYMMVVMMSITAFSISSGIAVYWITSNIFTIIQNILVKRSVKNGRN